jgi:hypothetical protein
VTEWRRYGIANLSPTCDGKSSCVVDPGKSMQNLAASIAFTPQSRRMRRCVKEPTHSLSAQV